MNGINRELCFVHRAQRAARRRCIQRERRGNAAKVLYRLMQTDG